MTGTPLRGAITRRDADGPPENPYVRPAVTPAVAEAVARSVDHARAGIAAREVGAEGSTVRYRFGDGTTETAHRTADPASGELTDRVTRLDGSTWTHSWDPAQGPAGGVRTTTAPDGTTTSLGDRGGEARARTHRPDGATVDVRITRPTAGNDHLLLAIDETGPDLGRQYVEVHLEPGSDRAWLWITGPDGVVVTHDGATVHETDHPDGSRTITVVHRGGDTDSVTVCDDQVVDYRSVTSDGSAVPGDDRDIRAELPAAVGSLVDHAVKAAHGPVVSYQVVSEAMSGTTARVTYADGTTDGRVRTVDRTSGLVTDRSIGSDGTTVDLLWRPDPDGRMHADRTTATHPDGTVVTTWYATAPDRSLTEITLRPDGTCTEVVAYSTHVRTGDGVGWALYRVADTDGAGRTTVTTYGYRPDVDGLVATIEGPDGGPTVVPLWMGVREVGTETVTVIVRPDGTTETFVVPDRAPSYDGFGGPGYAHWTT